MPLYKVDPNNSKKQIPVVNNRVLVKEVATPAEKTISKRPDHVLINQTGSYSFLYTTTASLGGVEATLANYVSGAAVRFFSGVGAVTPTKLDINPVAWYRDDTATNGPNGATGDVTFVFKGKYVQDGGPK